MLAQGPLEVRPAVEEDLQQIIDIHTQSFPIVYDQEFYRALFRSDRVCLVAAIKDHVIGVISASFSHKTGELYIMTLCKVCERAVDDKQFFGRLKQFCSKASRIGLHVLQQNAQATSLYIKAGFQVVRVDHGHYLIDNRYYDALLMQCSLE